MGGPAMTGRYPYSAWLFRAALCDLVDEKDGTMEASDESVFHFSLPVYGNRSSFLLTLKECDNGGEANGDASELTIEVERAADGLTKEGMRRAMHYVLDNMQQRIENELLR